MKKKLISILTVLCMVLTMIPTVAFAADVLEGSCGDDISWVLDTSTGTLTVSGTGAMKDYAYFADVPWAKNRTSIKKIVVESGITHIGKCAFNMWAVSGEQLTTVELPDTVTSIGQGAFTACETLVSCNLPDSITSIGGYAFSGCESLKSTKLPASLTSMGDEVFMDCTGLGDTLEFPAGLTEIPEEAYSGCTGIKRVTLHDGITSIGNSAFEETSIQKIVIPSSVNTIGSGAFRSCKSLRFVDMKGGTAITSWTFTNCSALEKINFPDTLTSVTGNYVFYNCDALSYLYFPASVTKIGGDCLAAYCDNLKTVCIANPECELPTYNGYDLGTVGQTTIYGESNSTAKAYATAKGYAFKTLDAAPAAPADPVISDNPSAPQFKDVASDAYYANAVAWAVANDITAGTSNTTFSPSQACTRAQAVTFLWRAAGEPEPTRTSNPFRDVSSGQYYYKAVLWAVENGVTSGMTATSFAPNQTCTRAQIVTFQWRAAGEPTATGSNTFRDVAKNAYYASAVQWAVKNGVTAGTSATTFSPNAACTRAQIVTFLYRAER